MLANFLPASAYACNGKGDLLQNKSPTRLNRLILFSCFKHTGTALLSINSLIFNIHGGVVLVTTFSVVCCNSLNGHTKVQDLN